MQWTNAWEEVTPGNHPTPTTHRLRVDGGWIYFMNKSHNEPCAVFVPDAATPIYTNGFALPVMTHSPSVSPTYSPEFISSNDGAVAPR